MSEQSLDRADRQSLLSALMDGEATSAEAAQACQSWRDDESSRRAWVSYQLIGDVLRSDELASGAGSDRFLKKLRTQLADEPVVLAPQAAARVAAASHVPALMAQGGEQAVEADRVSSSMASMAPRSPRARTWSGPMAVAAAFVAVLGGVLALQSPGGVPTGTPGVVVASGAPGTAGLPTAGGATLMTGFGPVTPSMAFGAPAPTTTQSFSEQARPGNVVAGSVPDVAPLQVGTGDAPFVQQASDRGADLVWVIR